MIIKMTVPFGFYASSGDYFITECFDIEANRKTQPPQNLNQILENTHARYCSLEGVAHFRESTKILLIAQCTDENKSDLLLEIIFDKDQIKMEEVKPMSLVALMSAMNSNPTFWENVGCSLRRIACFDNNIDFLNYHINLIRYIWQEQLKFDDNISSHIDLYCHHKRSSTGALIPSEALHQNDYLEQISLWTKTKLL